MIHISSMADLESIRDNFELWREAYGFLAVCAYEIQEYGNEGGLDDHDFNLFILNEDEEAYIMDLGTPEETVLTRIK